LKGKWSEALFGKVQKDSEKEIELWKANPQPARHEWMYYFTNFALQLNNLPENLKSELPRSDSRLRPD